MKMINGIYVITDEQICPGRTHIDIAQAAIEGGAKILQLRDKNATDLAFYRYAVKLREITKAAGVLFFINDRVHIAAAVGADGVNVGQSDMPVSAVRKVLGKDAIIGVSADGLEQAVQAQSDGADYVGFGPIFPTSTKLDAGPVSGLETLDEVCKGISIPVVAIGGISSSNIGLVAAAGAPCAAVVSAVVCAENMARATSELIELFDNGGKF